MVWNPWAILGAVIIIFSFFVMEFMESVVNATCNKNKKKVDNYKPMERRCP